VLAEIALPAEHHPSMNSLNDSIIAITIINTANAVKNAPISIVPRVEEKYAGRF
jgi:hypothetical protein